MRDEILKKKKQAQGAGNIVGTSEYDRLEENI